MNFYNKNSIRKQACDYSGSYTDIYDSPYGICFVFVDQEEEDEISSLYIPSLPSSQSHFSKTIAEA